MTEKERIFNALNFFWKAIVVVCFKVSPAFHYKSSLRCGLYISIRFKFGRFLLLLKVEWQDSEKALFLLFATHGKSCWLCHLNPIKAGCSRFFIGAEAGAGLNRPKEYCFCFPKKHYNTLIPF